MDELLAKAGSQAVTFAVKSGVSLASSYAIKTIGSFLLHVESSESRTILKLKNKLEDRIDIVSAAIDLIKLVAARGNTNLQSTLKITQSLKEEISQFDTRISSLLSAVEDSSNQKTKNEAIKEAEEYIRDLLRRVEEITPYINLALTTSGANLSTSLAKGVSPGLLLQASNFVCVSNEKFDPKDESSFQVGPTFETTMFSVFYNINSEDHINWKEDMKRALVTISRTVEKDNSEQYAYKVVIKQSFDDGRYHNTEDGEEKPVTITFDIANVEKIYFSVSGRLLKLNECDSAVLILKVAKEGDERDAGDDKSGVNWFAFGGYDVVEDSDSEDDSDESTTSHYSDCKVNVEQQSNLIGLLEYIIRLASLQQNDQSDVLKVSDERLSVYLNDENPNSIKAAVDLKGVTTGIDNLTLGDRK
ncbi:Yrb30 protein [Maudiozyma humilis]|uniref:Yrb30 protein n=1 Tax=Maudiozyma humilis TaxID=51915 RepID=A0AAV5RTB4_MAUHU|nr:Yrb30 protein [Kazachstania humilis]